ncbi:MAG: dihydrolipoyl dehydrogenase [Chloroflexi bacterium RBG_16_69_14]|nr:MAG: dihydrolipoyl dehydrogenase [Chloroflexi bacterium RBG_16_69_14]
MAVGSSNDFDLVVLGAGTGGYAAAFRAGQLGLKVALVDEDKIGGTCLHRGCIPTKALLESAAFADRVRHAKDYGLVLPGEAVVDYAAMAARRDAVVKRMWTGLKTLVDKNKVTWVAGRGRLDGPGKVRVSQPGEDGAPGAGGERILNATDVIVATGSRVKSLPGLDPDGRRILTSDDILKMDTLPKDIVIVGAGAVGVEFASMFADLGVKVTLLEYLPQIVPLEDADVSKLVERSFTKRGITVMTNARFDASSVTSDDAGICLMVGPDGVDPAELRAELMLVATGRAANIEDIGLETTKVEIDHGVIKVNGRMRTKEPHVYAVGDVVGGLWLAHTAAHEGLIAAHTIAGDADVHDMDYTRQPHATYCRPEIASIGLTEAQCAERGLKVKIGKVPFQAIAKAIIGGEYEGFVKVIANAATDDTLGVHIVGPHATDLIAEASLAFELDATPWEIGAATHAHPTLSEVMGEAAMAVDGRSINF